VVDRVDPARTGVKAGRVVGVLTAVLAVVSLAQARGSFDRSVSLLLDLAGIDVGLPVAALFWGNVVLAAVARYALCYAVGSLVGVAYEWLDRPSLPVLAGMTLIVGAVDGLFAAIDTRSVAFGVAYLLAWFCYVPVFARLFDPDAGDDRSGPRRLS
jgi:hypothetical protein